MSEHAAGGAVARGPLEFVRESAGGVSAAFVLLAQMLTLGLIAYGTLGPVSGRSRRARRVRRGDLRQPDRGVLGGALLPNEIPRASTVLVFAAFVARLAGDPALRGMPGERRRRRSCSSRRCASR